MKRIVLTLVALLGMVSAWSQTDEISKEQADKLNAITLKLMEQKRYDDAIKSLVNRTFTLYVPSVLFLSFRTSALIVSIAFFDFGVNLG
jgi:hypothetical protein